MAELQYVVGNYLHTIGLKMRVWKVGQIFWTIANGTKISTMSERLNAVSTVPIPFTFAASPTTDRTDPPK